MKSKGWARAGSEDAARPAPQLRSTTRSAVVAALVFGACLVLLQSATEQRALSQPAALDETERDTVAPEATAARDASAAFDVSAVLEASAAFGESAARGASVALDESSAALHESSAAAEAAYLLGDTLAAPVRRRSVGCSMRTVARSGWREILVGNVTRRFFLGVPRDYDPAGAARSMLVVLHGRTTARRSETSWFSERNTFVKKALQRGWLAVVPLALNDADLVEQGWRAGSFVNSLRTWGWTDSTSGVDARGRATCHLEYRFRVPTGFGSCEGVPRAGLNYNNCSWGPCGGADGNHDTLFVETLIDRVQTTMCVDPANTLVYGTSMGGMFTWYLASLPRVARRLRAVAVCNARPERGTLRHKGVSGDLPLLSVSALKDEIVPPGKLGWHGTTRGVARHIQGRAGLFVSASQALDSWARDHGCERARELPNASTALALGEGFMRCFSVCERDQVERPRVVDCRGPINHVVRGNHESLLGTLLVEFFQQHLLMPSEATLSSAAGVPVQWKLGEDSDFDRTELAHDAAVTSTQPAMI
jgi:poly(3-hydroxybutyrate) depolymerase